MLREKPILQIPATILTLGLMWLLPFLFHLIPYSGEVQPGAQLLPIYYAPLIAAWLFNPFVGIASSLIMPFLNHTITGMPALNISIVLSIELGVFSLLLIMFRERWAHISLLAPMAAVTGKLVSALLLFIIPIVPLSPSQYFMSSVSASIPGLLVLLVINMLLIRFSTKAE